MVARPISISTSLGLALPLAAIPRMRITSDVSMKVSITRNTAPAV
jgi:hypothetical protein